MSKNKQKQLYFILQENLKVPLGSPTYWSSWTVRKTHSRVLEFLSGDAAVTTSPCFISFSAQCPASERLAGSGQFKGKLLTYSLFCYQYTYNFGSPTPTVQGEWCLPPWRNVPELRSGWHLFLIFVYHPWINHRKYLFNFIVDFINATMIKGYSTQKIRCLFTGTSHYRT